MLMLKDLISSEIAQTMTNVSSSRCLWDIFKKNKRSTSLLITNIVQSVKCLTDIAHLNRVFFINKCIIYSCSFCIFCLLGPNTYSRKDEEKTSGLLYC